MGWGIRALRRWLHEFVHGTEQQQIHDEIERQICDQLNSRPPSNEHWPQDGIRRQIVESLAEAVRQEKKYLLKHVMLHLEDPIVLLLWGSYDDLTPLVFCRNLETAFDLSVSTVDWESILQIGRAEWFEDDRTVGHLVEQLIAMLPEKGDAEEMTTKNAKGHEEGARD